MGALRTNFVSMPLNTAASNSIGLGAQLGSSPLPVNIQIRGVQNGFVVINGFDNEVRPYNSHVFTDGSEVVEHLKKLLVEPTNRLS
jgi:hypothetical protein